MYLLPAELQPHALLTPGPTLFIISYWPLESTNCGNDQGDVSGCTSLFIIPSFDPCTCCVTCVFVLYHLITSSYRPKKLLNPVRTSCLPKCDTNFDVTWLFSERMFHGSWTHFNYCKFLLRLCDVIIVFAFTRMNQALQRFNNANSHFCLPCFTYHSNNV